MRTVLFIILFITITACSSTRKVDRSKTAIDVSSNSVSKEEGNTETSTNLKIDKTIETSSDGETTEEHIVIKAADSTKEAVVQLQDGTKVVLNNAVYTKTKVFKKESSNKKEVVKLDSIAETKIDFKKEEVIQTDIVSEAKEDHIDKKSNTFNWLYILIPCVLIASGYVLYKFYPGAKLFNLFRKT